MASKLVKYEAKDGFRWRFVASNGKIIAEGGEAYSSKFSLNRAVKTVVSELSGDFLEEEKYDVS